jgi:hypothetical protein
MRRVYTQHVATRVIGLQYYSLVEGAVGMNIGQHRHIMLAGSQHDHGHDGK